MPYPGSVFKPAAGPLPAGGLFLNQSPQGDVIIPCLQFILYKIIPGRDKNQEGIITKDNPKGLYQEGIRTNKG